ncbi:MT-A70 family methyltransferase [Nostoc sp. UHCC 0870]|uniref:MT-A70 family methyltransferase n=1 Tax=Nostoc sp. UHCC 0870 TaxID=2914041 RepID=UPI001EDE6C8E|nr:MT-A70 family methyltransferase [Nostoc sp. UHCC 0870]UKP00965.1 MT-A70 family methyltransferase [Nostoc sp. UHCC 0870]
MVRKFLNLGLKYGIGNFSKRCTHRKISEEILRTSGLCGERWTLTNESTILHSPRREHSRKLPQFFELVDKLCPDMTKLEMFARESRDGWDCWGDEADLFDELSA